MDLFFFSFYRFYGAIHHNCQEKTVSCVCDKTERRKAGKIELHKDTIQSVCIEIYVINNELL